MHGFILMAKGKTFEFYSVSADETNTWIEALKEFVILLDLKEEFTIGKILGKGNSAKVHRCERKNNPKQHYALKTIQKSFIKSNPRNIVSLLLKFFLPKFIFRAQFSKRST